MQPNKPTKEAVRSYTQLRTREKSPPPTPEQIRRELGWGMIKPSKGGEPSPR